MSTTKDKLAACLYLVSIACPFVFCLLVESWPDYIVSIECYLGTVVISAFLHIYARSNLNNQLIPFENREFRLPTVSPQSMPRLSQAQAQEPTLTPATVPVSELFSTAQIEPSVKVKHPANTALDSDVSRSLKNRQQRVLTIENYKRNQGVPGFLYIARNTMHRDGLVKIGQTSKKSPQLRIDELNEEHSKASDIGTFELIDSVPVDASYDAEQALHLVLSTFRVTPKREFFVGPLELFQRGLNAAAAFSRGEAEMLNFFSMSLPATNGTFNFPEKLEHCTTPPLVAGKDGWLIVCRNVWHKPDVYRIAATSVHPAQAMKRFNLPQRQMAAQLGFYGLVYCVAVTNPQKFAMLLKAVLRAARIEGNRSFYCLPLGQLTESIHSLTTAHSPLINESLEKLNGEKYYEVKALTKRFDLPIFNRLTHGSSIKKSTTIRKARCPTCRIELGFVGTPGTEGFGQCPACDTTLTYLIGVIDVKTDTR